MDRINYTITLKSDGELSSGFGTELIDSILPRNMHGYIIIPSSHIKGIIRENLENIPDKFIPSSAVMELFGKENDSASFFHMGDVVAHENTKVFNITRTKLNDFGVADSGALRTSEAVAAGTEFTGAITLQYDIPTEYKDMLKLGLLSLTSIGGGRNRGAGSCVVTIDNEQRMPGELLRTLSNMDFSKVLLEKRHDENKPVVVSDEQVFIKLVFKASNPVCVPEVPISKNNVIHSGFSIPASAVQGAVLHRINDISEKVATACYNSRNFRAWPLHPADKPESISLRIPLTHKISKSKIETTGNYHFEDEMVNPYNYYDLPVSSPLKTIDGVLVTDGFTIKLWRSSDMARIITAHGVHNGDRFDKSNAKKRNLYTVESLAQTLFTGILSIPKTASDLFLKSLNRDSFVHIGKARSVRGGGDLSAEIIDFASLPIMKKFEETVFIVQSPVLVPQSLVGKSTKEIISNIVQESGFGGVEKAIGSLKIQFGWNRTMYNGFLKGKVVIAPGAVFKLRAAVNNIEEKICAGVGQGREFGFGAILPHPGVAEQLFSEEVKPITITKPEMNFGKEGFELWEKAKDAHLSSSQISRVRELTILDKDKALKYLKRQKNDRPEDIWNKWKGVIGQLEQGIQNDPEHMHKVLKVCQDLLVADKGGN